MWCFVQPFLVLSLGPSEEAGGSGVRGVRSGSEPADLGTAARSGATAGQSGQEERRCSEQSVGRP